MELVGAAEKRSPASAIPVCGIWSVRDVMAHVAAWDRELLRAVDEVAAGREPSFTREAEDAFNNRVVAAAKSADLPEVLAEARHAHDALLARIADIPHELWARDSGQRWETGQRITVASLFAYSYRGSTHYRGHAQDIKMAHAEN